MECGFNTVYGSLNVVFTYFSCDFSDWMRRHCMDTFHYVATKLKHKPLFETQESADNSPRVDSIYNDFDNENPFQSDEEIELSFTTTQNLNQQPALG